MRFLSIAERELRAGARHKRTHRLRWMTASVFLGLLFWLMWAFDNFRAPDVFAIFSTLTFIYCLIIGTVFTADCLSSEKREGTLGLLFLTNLNGPEIVAGKLCSSALAAAYGLFAIFPLLGLQMLIGGITLGNFWRVVLAMLNTIFFSVGAGFLASAFCTRQFIAIASATGLALFFSAGLMAIAAVINAFRGPAVWVDGVAIFSPIYDLISADDTRVFGRKHYWLSFFAVTAFACACLGLATLRVSSSWRDRATGVGILNLNVLQRWRRRGTAGRAALRRRLLEINPFFWLAGRARVTAPVFILLLLAGFTIVQFVAAPYFGRVMRAGTLSPMFGNLMAWFWAGVFLHIFVLYYAAMTASRRLAEDKQTGALELVLSTPTSERSISRGLWMAYARSMFFPAVAAPLVHCFVAWQGASLAVEGLPPDRLPPGTTPAQLLWHAFINRPIAGFELDWSLVFGMRIVLLVLLLCILVWITLGWVARWLGLRMKHPGFAPLISLALILIPPVLLFSFACYCASQWNLDCWPNRIFFPMMMWVAFGIGSLHCLALSSWAAGRLRRDFRVIVTSRFQPAPLRPWWRPTRQALLRVGIAIVSLTAALLIITVSFYGYQNWRSRRAWSAFQAAVNQRHESLDLSQLLPGPVPESQNFASSAAFRKWVGRSADDPAGVRLSDALRKFLTFPANPANPTEGIDWTSQNFAPLGAYLVWFNPKPILPPNASSAVFGQTLLDSLVPYNQTIRALAAAATLPFFQTSTNRNPLAILSPAVNESAALERLHVLFQIRACALLSANRTDEAAEDLLIGLQLVRHAQQLTDAQSPMRVQTMLARSLQPLWEGIVDHRWTADQLATFQHELSAFNLLSNYTNAISLVVRAHIQEWQRLASGRDALVFTPPRQGSPNDSFWELEPRAWWLDDCRQLYRAGENAIRRVDIPGGYMRLDVDWRDIDSLPLDEKTTFLFQQSHWMRASPHLVAFAQTAVNQAIIACALERYRLANDKFPEALAQLVPIYLRAIPNDIVLGKPLLYENPSQGHFILRGVGPNLTNDRNKPTSDDWLWSFPTNAPPRKAR